MFQFKPMYLLDVCVVIICFPPAMVNKVFKSLIVKSEMIFCTKLAALKGSDISSTYHEGDVSIFCRLPTIIYKTSADGNKSSEVQTRCVHFSTKLTSVFFYKISNFS